MYESKLFATKGAVMNYGREGAGREIDGPWNQK